MLNKITKTFTLIQEQSHIEKWKNEKKKKKEKKTNYRYLKFLQIWGAGNQTKHYKYLVHIFKADLVQFNTL